MRAGVLGAAFAGMCTCGATALLIRGCCGAAGAARLRRASSKAAGTAGVAYLLALLPRCCWLLGPAGGSASSRCCWGC